MYMARAWTCHLVVRRADASPDVSIFIDGCSLDNVNVVLTSMLNNKS